MLSTGRLILLLCLMHASAHAIDLVYKPAPPGNPLKGLVGERSFRFGRETPHSLEFLDVALANLMPAPDRFDWSTLDGSLERIGQLGFQSVVRVFLDWPGRADTIPEFLFGSTHLVADGWRKGERYPDYKSPEVRAALTNFIAAFGKRYDGNPNIAFIEAGLLGAWGEWLPVSTFGPTASPEFQKEILASFQSVFVRTHILVRYPSEFTIDSRFGYHDDWFGDRERELPYFFAKLQITNSPTWRTAPIGGRIHPEIQSCIWKFEPCRFTEDDYLQRIRSNHITYLRLGSRFGDSDPIVRDRMVRFDQTLGYELHVSAAEIAYSRNSLTITATITNTGVAPFYYKWPVEIALARGTKLQQTWITDWDIRNIIPGDPATTFTFTTDLTNPAEQYLVLLRIQNPAPQGPNFSFANESQNATMNGWLTLGDLR